MIDSKNNFKKLMIASLAASAFAGCVFSTNSFAEEEPLISIWYEDVVENFTNTEEISTSADGKITYDPIAKILTINNENQARVSDIAVREREEVEVVLSGTNNFMITGYNLRISGTGIMNCPVNVDANEFCIAVVDRLVIDSGTINITGEYIPESERDADEYFGIALIGYEDEVPNPRGVIINGGAVSIKDVNIGIGSLGGLAVNGGTVSIENSSLGAVVVMARNEKGEKTTKRLISLGENVKITEKDINFADFETSALFGTTEEDSFAVTTLANGVLQYDEQAEFSWSSLKNIAKTVHFVSESEEDAPGVPDTGLFSKDGNFVKLLPAGILAGIAILVAALKLSASRETTKRRVRKF